MLASSRFSSLIGDPERHWSLPPQFGHGNLFGVSHLPSERRLRSGRLPGLQVPLFDPAGLALSRGGADVAPASVTVVDGKQAAIANMSHGPSTAWTVEKRNCIDGIAGRSGNRHDLSGTE
jgi:hypothetical protein